MRPMRLVAVVGILILLLASNCFGWGVVGHKTVGRIAAALLSPTAQKMVADKLHVANTKSAVANAMADAAEWPDAVARDRYSQSIPWHFIDLGAKAGPGDDAQWQSKTTAFAKLVQYYASVRAGAKDELEDGSDLKFIAHLVGDIHQPLHTETDQDRGGNCLYVRLTLSGNPGAEDQLHHDWDDTLVTSKLGTNDTTIAASLVKEWNAMMPAEQKALVGMGLSGQIQADLRAWINESHARGVDQVYKKLTPSVPLLGTADVKSDCSNAAPFAKSSKSTPWVINTTETAAAETAVKEQVIRAGVRLAWVLNAIAAAN